MKATAVATTVECLRFEPSSPRADQMFEALSQASASVGVAFQESCTYQGGADWLLLWGPGAPNRFGPMQQQLAAGGHVLALDLAYWQRDTKVRISIDAAHPQWWVMRKHWPLGRFEADHVPVTDRWNPDGPVLVAGIGAKARVQYGAALVDAWEARQVRGCIERLPMPRPIRYRQKKGQGIAPEGAHVCNLGSIEQALDGVSLVITYHSNVAVDAIRHGIPVICHTGAAAAVCPFYLPTDGRVQPLPIDLRDRFLANLAWFQWAPSEAAACWQFVRELLA